MAPTRRVTFTLPAKLAQSLRRLAGNRNRFVEDAIRRELARRRRESLLAALEAPHPETGRLAEVGLAEWASAGDDGAELVDPLGGTPIRWCPVNGWITGGAL